MYTRISTKIALCLRTPVAHVVYLTVTLLALSCTEYMHPSGQWSEPVDLSMDQESLQDVVIKLSCVRSKVPGLIDDPSNDSSQNQPCSYFAGILEEAGAVIYRPGNEEKNQETSGTTAAGDRNLSETEVSPFQLLVQYKEVSQEENNCTLGFLPFYFTLTFWPCRSDTISRANLVIAVPETGFAQEWPMAVETHSYFGAGALILKFIDLFKEPSNSQYESQLKENFVKFVRNKTYSVYRATNKKGG